MLGSMRNRDCISYPGVGTFVLIRPAQTFYERIKTAGACQVEGDVEAEQCRLRGSFRVAGLINAEQIEVELDGSRSSAREIGGSKIKVRSRSGWFRRAGQLTVESIKGDEIHLEATDAQIVRGKTVVVGHGCRIGTVEYAESLEVDPKASVENQVKTG